MTKKRILFVGDEPNILAGLKRMLRSMRKEFDLCFAENGMESLEIMKVFKLISFKNLVRCNTRNI